ncbi:MAG TPA: hypothetical protein VGT40_25125 [Methylomirabilota bacterium]|jgi:DNA-binding response OmpR family regulator|nr:hypothetical protein [Methylomirabilota bacterium]
MTRILMIDGDRALAQSVALTCLEDGVAIRMAETLCEGVRDLLEGAVSLVLLDAALIRLPASDQARLFEAVAPGVPVVILVSPATPMEEVVKLELHGFHVVHRPFDVRQVLAKVEPTGRFLPAGRGAARQVKDICG